MSSPALPRVPVFEGLQSCVIAGRELTWTNCTPAGFAMAVNLVTLWKRSPTACGIRKLTGDTSGGTTLAQNAAVIREDYGVATEVRVGSNVCSPGYLATQLRAGRPANVQGNAGVLVRAKSLAGASLRSTYGYVNHNVFVTDGRGWHLSGGVWLPKEVRVYDPAANGRRAGWGRAALAPDWWPWSVLLAFMAALRPWGDNDARLLGPGKVYCGIHRDMNPHVHLRYTGSVPTSPLARMFTVFSRFADRRAVKVFSGPANTGTLVERLAHGSGFRAYQQNPQGQLLVGSRLWYGDHDGKRWVHSSNLRG